MSEFRADELVERLNKLGLMLTATRLADGSIRLNQWRTMNYYENEGQIKAIWSNYVSGNDARMREIAVFVEASKPARRSLHS